MIFLFFVFVFDCYVYLYCMYVQHQNFATLHDLICKNLDMILKPKGENDDSSGRNMMMM